MNTEYLFPMLLARDKGGGGGGGTVTEIATGAGLTTDDGQAITSSGTIKANLADDTALSGANLYNIGVDSTGYLAVVVPWTDTTYTFDGTYNASTNPAATVSTVTNAINALDVAGASSIPASKTISAWSETDGKVSVSTQDIAIAGSQAVLTGYAKASTATAIVATDTLNQAVGKLEKGLDGKQATIDSSHKLSADLVDDTSATHKFATAAQLSQIGTNENNISSLQDSVNGREFTFTSGGNIATNVDVGATVDITPNPVGSWSYTVSPCNAGEVITITGQGGSTPRLWAFTDKDYKLISKSADGAGMTGGTVTAPTNAAYCIINSTTATLGFCGIYGVKDDISTLQAKTTGMSEGGSNYITVGGIRVYVSATAPTGARTGDMWIGG